MEGITNSILPTPHIEHETMIVLYLHVGSSNSSLLVPECCILKGFKQVSTYIGPTHGKLRGSKSNYILSEVHSGILLLPNVLPLQH